MSINALFTYDYGKENMDLVKALGYDIIIKNEKDITYSNELKDTEVLVCYNPFSSLDIGKMKGLKWIQLSSIGIDQLPLEKVTDKCIHITNNRGGYSIPMGEWIVMKILELLKNSFGLYVNQLNKRWKMDTGILELYGKTVGFIGTGTIAMEAAKRLQGFEVKTLGINTSGSKMKYFDECFRGEEIDDVLPKCDIIVVSIPSTKETYHLINEDSFSKIKNGTFLINIARGNIIDEKALIRNLQTGKLGGAALDVFEEEPLPLESPLWHFQNVSITPHNSWISEMRNERRWKVIYENLKRYSKGEGLINAVNLEKGY